MTMGLVSRPVPPLLRDGEMLLWRGQPAWRGLAARVFHVRGLVFYVCALLFANGLAARLQELSPREAMQGEIPVVIAGGLLVALALAAAWATARTTLYSVTNQRVVLQYGLALPATLSLPMRLIAAVAVAPEAGNVPIRLKPGHILPIVKLWPHARPWRVARPEPMFRSLPDATEAAAMLARMVASAQADAGLSHRSDTVRVREAA